MTPTLKAFAVRFTAAMDVVAAATAPAQGDTLPQHIAAIRMGSDGRLHALAHGTTSGGGVALMHLRLLAETLELESATLYPRASGYRLHRGRAISGGVSVAAATKPHAQGGFQPLLITGRDAGLQEIELPMPEPLAGLPTAINVSTASIPTATAAAGGRAVFAANLSADSGAAVGFHIAAVQLETQAGAGDHVDTRFANQGAGGFRFTTQNGACWGPQSLGNISSWGASTALVGMAPPGCDVGIEHPLVARINSEPILFGDSFDRSQDG